MQYWYFVDGFRDNVDSPTMYLEHMDRNLT